ncbi:hypothetical protein pb186bvf_011103 [Paramecium bursaria]
MQIPVGETDHFNSVVDLITQQEIRWLDKLGNEIEFVEFQNKALLKEKRDELLSEISLFDDQIADLYLEDSKELLNQQLLINAIRKALHSNPTKICPVYVGSALKNRGIQPLLDAIGSLLPSPQERPPIFDFKNPNLLRKLDKSEKLTAYMYKIIQDADLGPLAFTRIYSGQIDYKTNFQNSTKDEAVKVQNIYRVRANKYVPITSATAGDIVALQTKQGSPGSTIINNNDPQFVLQPLNLPQCVFFARLEYESSKDKLKIDQALQTLQMEDDSLKITLDEESQQIIIGGQGELHLEIVVQRLKEDFGLKTTLKKMQVEYKESISEFASDTLKYQEVIKGRPLWFELELTLEPIESQTNELIFDFERSNDFDAAYKEFKDRQKQQNKSANDSQIRFIKNPEKVVQVDSIIDENGEEAVYDLASMPFTLFYNLESMLQASLNKGFLLSNPLIGIRATIESGRYITRRTTELAIGRCVSQIMKNFADKVKPLIMEPVMNIEISCPNKTVQSIMNDLISVRRGKVDEILDDKSRFGKEISGRTIIKGIIPLSETVGYSTQIRSLSQGEAYFTTQFKNYGYVGGEKEINQLVLREANQNRKQDKKPTSFKRNKSIQFKLFIVYSSVIKY